MFCKNCGNKIPEGAKFCGKCGKEIVVKKEKRLSVDSQAIEKDLRVYDNATRSFPKNESNIVMKLVKFFAIGLVSIAVIGILSGLVIVALSGNKDSSQKTSEQDKGWQTYVSASDQFSVFVPNYPKIDSESGIPVPDTDLTYAWHSYMAEKDNKFFYIHKYIYSDIIDVSNKDAILEALLNEMINVDSKFNLISSKYTYHSSYRALDFIASYEDRSVKGRIIVVGQTPYLLMVEYLSDNDIGTDYQKFVNSFEIKK